MGQAGRYAVAGAAATAVDWGTFAVLHATGLPPEASAAGSVIAGTLTNFALNRAYTFRSQAAVSHTGPRYAAVWIVAFAATVTLVGGLTQVGVPPVPARMLTTGLMFPLNFVMLKLFAFRDAAASRPAPADAKGLPPEDA